MGETDKLEGEALAASRFRYFPYVMAAFVAILLLSNVIGASKPSYVTLPGGEQWAVVALPPAEGWTGQAAYESVFGNTWRIVAASMTAFWAGEFANSFVLAKLKLLTAGRFLWMRTIGSTVVGQGLDSLIFYPLAFYGLAGWPVEQLWQVVLSQWAIKTAWEALLTPVTYAVVGFLKRHEGVEVFDTDTDFSPFAKAR